ncbi:hypothetical protein EI94DRAFT_1757649 [Lactarius quietus]|nr:hypothetical protein EI94DRAFT_1757649 [Lactarius quietus]
MCRLRNRCCLLQSVQIHSGAWMLWAHRGFQVFLVLLVAMPLLVHRGYQARPDVTLKLLFNVTVLYFEGIKAILFFSKVLS